MMIAIKPAIMILTATCCCAKNPTALTTWRPSAARSSTTTTTKRRSPSGMSPTSAPCSASCGATETRFCDPIGSIEDVDIFFSLLAAGYLSGIRAEGQVVEFRHASNVLLSRSIERLGMISTWHKPGLHMRVGSSAGGCGQHKHIGGRVKAIFVPMNEKNWSWSDACDDIHRTHRVVVDPIQRLCRAQSTGGEQRWQMTPFRYLALQNGCEIGVATIGNESSDSWLFCRRE